MNKAIKFALLFALLLALVAGLAQSTGATQPDEVNSTLQPESTVKPCSTVSPRVWNKRVRALRVISDRPADKRRFSLTRKPVCKRVYKKLKAALRRARADCFKPVAQGGHLRSATASHYGRGDGFLGGGLACGGTLYAGQIGTAHKTLPCGKILYFKKSGGGSVSVPVIDRGPFVAGREFDLTSWTADVVGGFDGVGGVTYSYRNCWAR